MVVSTLASLQRLGGGEWVNLSLPSQLLDGEERVLIQGGRPAVTQKSRVSACGIR